MVIGAGFAAQASAITAHDAGAKVLMSKRHPKLQGGNSRSADRAARPARDLGRLCDLYQGVDLWPLSPLIG